MPHVTPVALATISPHDALRSGIKLCSSSITIEPSNGQNNNQINRVPGNASQALTVRQAKPAQ
ncbi:hypothetical protein D3C75_1292960 [compost metagenome]